MRPVGIRIATATLLAVMLPLSAPARADPPPEIFDFGREPPISRVPGTQAPARAVLNGLVQLSKEEWGEQQVRHVLRTFAYGGQATDQQLAVWAAMAPGAAIAQMLNFDPVNLRLSPQGREDPSSAYCHSLRLLQEFWSSDDPENPMRVANRPFYATLGQQRPVVSPLHLHLAWSRTVHTPGCNAFLHKMALYITNYHASIHIQNTGPSLIRRYYDDVVQALAGNANFIEVMTLAASHAALSLAYGHMGNSFDEEGVFRGNDDFAREYFQLLFGIQGTTEDEGYHEDTTIEHNAWLLTGMILDIEPRAWGSRRRLDWYVAPIDFSNHRDLAGRVIPNQSLHFGSAARDASCLEILHQQICGPNAQAKLEALGPVAAAHPESMASIPLKIIGFFGDDRLDEEESIALQAAWADARFNWLTFIQAYATSTLFHSGDAFKLRSAFDRNLAIHNANQLSAGEAYSELFRRGPLPRMFDQGALVFAPIRDVFGGQTGTDAANDRFVFKKAWDANVTDPQFLAATADRYRLVPDGEVLAWRKNWAAVIPANRQGKYIVGEVGEWLWNRFVGDGGKNFDRVARVQVNALLATGFDFGAIVDERNPQVVFSSAELSNGTPGEIARLIAAMDFNFREGNANQRIGMAINFITALPYTFATGAFATGGDQ